MPSPDLRPLSLGEILDRTFSLYRRNFLLFVGITAIPQLFVLAMQLIQVLLSPAGIGKTQRSNLATMGTTGTVALVVGAIVGLVVYMVAYLFAHGGTVFAVSELNLGRNTTIGASLRRMRGQAAGLFGVLMLNGLATIAATICFIIPGMYVACRLLTCVPASLLENLGARESLERSWFLTKDNAGRSFVIYVLYFALLYGAVLLFSFPFLMALAFSMKDPAMVRTWTAFSQVGNFIAAILVTPIFTIAGTVFYYDLRVRKEAFDLQLMMNPAGNVPTPASGGVPSMFS
jgi:hypothetical protein